MCCFKSQPCSKPGTLLVAEQAEGGKGGVGRAKGAMRTLGHWEAPYLLTNESKSTKEKV